MQVTNREWVSQRRLAFFHSYFSITSFILFFRFFCYFFHLILSFLPLTSFISSITSFMSFTHFFSPSLYFYPLTSSLYLLVFFSLSYSFILLFAFTNSLHFLGLGFYQFFAFINLNMPLSHSWNKSIAIWIVDFIESIRFTSSSYVTNSYPSVKSSHSVTVSTSLNQSEKSNRWVDFLYRQFVLPVLRRRQFLALFTSLMISLSCRLNHSDSLKGDSSGYYTGCSIDI